MQKLCNIEDWWEGRKIYHLAGISEGTVLITKKGLYFRLDDYERLKQVNDAVDLVRIIRNLEPIFIPDKPIPPLSAKFLDKIKKAEQEQ